MAKTHIDTTARYPFKEPFLSKPDDDNLAKQWVVEYGVWSEREEKLKRKRIVITGDTVADRLADAKEVVKLLKTKLREGVCVDALRQEPTRPDIDRNAVTLQTTLRKAIEFYLDCKQKTSNSHFAL